MRKFEEYFDGNAAEHIYQIKKVLEDAKLEAIEVVNLQLIKFREVNQMGKILNVFFIVSFFTYIEYTLMKFF